MDLEGSVALITGGASGMGLATASYLAKKGARVAIVDLDETKIRQAENEVEALAIVADVSDEQSIQKAFETVEKKLGFPRVCVHCAGILGGAKLVGREGPMKLEDFKRVIDTNLVGTFNVLRFAAAGMQKLSALPTQERGVLITTASVAAFEGQIGQVAYSASKAGVIGMILPIARELSTSGIRLMTIAPGLIETPMMENLPEKVKTRLQANVVFPARLGKTEEFSKLVLHIIENPLLNGEVIRLDGAVRLSAS